MSMWVARSIKAIKVIDDTGACGILVKAGGMGLAERGCGWGDAPLKEARVEGGELGVRWEE